MEVARRYKDQPKLVSSADLAFEDMEGDFAPSFNTLGRRAFTFYLRPHLNIIERRELQAFWASLPPFDPLRPNHDPTHPSKPAAPQKIGPALWDWSDMLQPARWFICPCALANHPCAFTGEAPFNCRGWHDVCTEQVSTILSLLRNSFLFNCRSVRTALKRSSSTPAVCADLRSMASNVGSDVIADSSMASQWWRKASSIGCSITAKLGCKRMTLPGGYAFRRECCTSRRNFVAPVGEH